MNPNQNHRKKIQLYRICMPEYTCPVGLQAVKFLQDRNLPFEDIKLQSQVEVDEFKTKYQVATTPQIAFGDNRMFDFADFATNIRQIESLRYSGFCAVF